MANPADYLIAGTAWSSQSAAHFPREKPDSPETSRVAGGLRYVSPPGRSVLPTAIDWSVGGIRKVARRTFPSRAALWVITAAVAVAMLSTVPASALPSASGASAPPRAGTAACRVSDLRISAPAAIQGDPAEGMGKHAWNLVFRDVGSTACALRGWPRLAVRTTAGKTVVTRIDDVRFSNLAVVPDTPIVLLPGQSAVVTAMSPTGQSGCVTSWVLELALPGAGGPVTLRNPASSLAPCVGGNVWLSPFYAQQTLTREITALKVSAAPPPFTPTTAAEPPVCTAAALRAHITGALSGNDGFVAVLQLSDAGGACVLGEDWPTVRVGEAGAADQVAKLFPDDAALQAERSLLSTYERGTAQSTVLTLRRGGSVSIALLAATTTAQACRRLTSVTVYPSAAALGAGSPASLAGPVSLCGSPRVLAYLPSHPGVAMAIARQALIALQAAPPQTTRQAKSATFYYGTDSGAPRACGTGPYTEPVGDCANGTDGLYGEYIGELGSYLNWEGCTDSGLNWVQANYNMATDNLIRYHTGLGAAAYWFAAGPGRDPHYNGTTAEAMVWGEDQAEQFLSDSSGVFLNFQYVFMDIENNGAAPDGNGWNTVWNGPCGNRVKAEFIAPPVDYATYQGFAGFIASHSPYRVGVYSAGGEWYGSWYGIFSPVELSHAAEWTFTNEQAQLGFPSGFSDSAGSADWFGGEPAACDLLWQWSGGNGVLNGYGDFDQADAANDFNPTC